MKWILDKASSIKNEELRSIDDRLINGSSLWPSIERKVWAKRLKSAPYAARDESRRGLLGVSPPESTNFRNYWSHYTIMSHREKKLCKRPPNSDVFFLQAVTSLTERLHPVIHFSHIRSKNSSQKPIWHGLGEHFIRQISSCCFPRLQAMAFFSLDSLFSLQAIEASFSGFYLPAKLHPMLANWLIN